MDKPLIEQAIEAIEGKRDNAAPLKDEFYMGKMMGFFHALNILRALLPKEEEQRKGDMLNGWNGRNWSLDDFTTWYNTINEKV